MRRTEEPLAKLDAPLIALLQEKELDPKGAVPVIVRCSAETIPQVGSAVVQSGGRVRHNLRMLGAVAAWLPLGSVLDLARQEVVRSMELEQEFAVA